MISRKLTVLVAVTLLAFLMIMPSEVSAQNSLDCQTVWTGPSADNNVVNCFTNIDRIKGQWPYFVFPGFSALLFLVLLVSFPILFFCIACCGCCKSSAEDFGEAGRCWNWMWIIYALLWSCGVTVLVIFGAKLLATSAPKIIDDTLDGPLKYFNETAEHIIDFTSNWTTGSREPVDNINLDLGAFSNVSDNVTQLLLDTKGQIDKYIEWVPIVSYCIGGVAVVLMIFMVFIACCRCCIPCMPFLFSCVYWIIGIIFALLGIVCILLAYISTTGCGEVELQFDRQPGVFQWYLVPYCESQFDFATINAEVSNAESTFAKDTCGELLTVCDNLPDVEIPNIPPFLSSKASNTFGNAANIQSIILAESPSLRQGIDPSIVVRPLNCGREITSADECPNFGIMADVLVNSSIKAVIGACPETGKPCTLTECAANCTIEDVKSASRNILQAALLARNASIALSYARPLLECNFVVDKLLGALTTCNDLKTGTLMLGVGFFVGGLMFGLAIYIMLRGSCIWRTQVTKDG